MRMLRWWCALAVAWPILFCEAERLLSGSDGPPLIYGLAALGALAVIALPGVRRLPLPALLAFPLPFFAARAWFGGDLGVQTVAEIAALEATLLLASALGRRLDVFEQAVERVSTLDLAAVSAPFEVGQNAMFREIGRARRYGRQVSLLSLGVDPRSTSASFDRLVEELQRRNVEHYARAEVARLLSEETGGCEVITCRDGHFVAMLPETSRENASELARRLDRLASERFGLSLRIGLASFPEQEITFEGLVRRAEAEMELASEPPSGVRSLVSAGRRRANGSARPSETAATTTAA